MDRSGFESKRSGSEIRVSTLILREGPCDEGGEQLRSVRADELHARGRETRCGSDSSDALQGELRHQMHRLGE